MFGGVITAVIGGLVSGGSSALLIIPMIITAIGIGSITVAFDSHGVQPRKDEAARGAVTSPGVGLSDPDDADPYDELISEITVGGAQPLAEPIRICDYDPAWAEAFEREASRVNGALGDRVVRLEHVGSTSVPGLPAKPIIDMVLEVADASNEPAYARALDSAGYVARRRSDRRQPARTRVGPRRR